MLKTRECHDTSWMDAANLNRDTVASPESVTHHCAQTCSRRELLRLLPALAVFIACGGESSATAPSGETNDAITVTGSRITVALNRINDLRTDGSALVISDQQLIILRLAPTDYRAFTNVCTHSGCGISIFDSSRMKCQCHGSEFDTSGVNVAGPAPLPLARYAVSLNAARTTLEIDKSTVVNL